jgi:hypothetical protein
MKAIVTPYDITTENAQAKRFVAMHLEGVASEADVSRETSRMSEQGTRSVLITDEQATRLLIY